MSRKMRESEFKELIQKEDEMIDPNIKYERKIHIPKNENNDKAFPRYSSSPWIIHDPREPLFRYRIIFSYDGKHYYGFAKQIELNSVEEEINKALSIITNEEQRIRASGRTDKGVHALNQVADFASFLKLEDLIENKHFLYRLNKLLPNDIYVKKIERVPRGFSSRFDALYKEYFYLINYKEYNPLMYDYEIFTTRIDFNKLNEIIPLFIGKHNFINFTSKEVDIFSNFEREIYDIHLEYPDENHLKIVFQGDGFMKYEIRKIVGTFFAYMNNKITLDEVRELLKGENYSLSNRKIVSFTVEAKALYLNKVVYEE